MKIKIKVKRDTRKLKVNYKYFWLLLCKQKLEEKNLNDSALESLPLPPVTFPVSPIKQIL
jgi:hypothetical protein